MDDQFGPVTIHLHFPAPAPRYLTFSFPPTPSISFVRFFYYWGRRLPLHRTCTAATVVIGNSLACVVGGEGVICKSALIELVCAGLVTEDVCKWKKLAVSAEGLGRRASLCVCAPAGAKSIGRFIRILFFFIFLLEKS